MSVEELFYEVHRNSNPQEPLKRELRKSIDQKLIAEIEVSIDERRWITVKKHWLNFGHDSEQDVYVDSWMERSRKECAAILRAS